MTSGNTDTAAEQLHEWFATVVRLTGETLFSIAPKGPHGDAVVLDVLKRNARILHSSRLDLEGKLYSPLCFFLVAACRILRTTLAAGHWQAALENVLDLKHQLESTRGTSATLGLEIGTPATLFKQELEEALLQAGVASGVSYLSKNDRQVALGLAVNWGMRLLLAYAGEFAPSTPVADQKNLTWLAHLVQPTAQIPRRTP